MQQPVKNLFIKPQWYSTETEAYILLTTLSRESGGSSALQSPAAIAGSVPWLGLQLLESIKLKLTEPPEKEHSKQYHSKRKHIKAAYVRIHDMSVALLYHAIINYERTIESKA